MQLLESHNQCPDCLSMELQVTPLPDRENIFELYLTTKFNQQRENVLEGKLCFGLTSAELTLTLENIAVCESIAEISPYLTKGSNAFATNPSWLIRAKPDSKFIQADLERVRLGTLKITRSPYLLKATVIVSSSDIHLSDIEGFWRYDITPNKHGVLERKLASFLLKTYLQPYVSQAIFGSPDSSFQPSLHHQGKNQIMTGATAELKEVLQTIYQSPTNNLKELAQIAGLNSLRDFAGANLVGAELTGLDLNGANLQGANLRGADLTDTDLSEANLSHAKLSGADLSGAYLEGANLHQANLQSASLALANLIGANLTKANLEQANLTKTSLANATVTGAIFAHNIGLDPQMQETLRARGAIFSV